MPKNRERLEDKRADMLYKIIHWIFPEWIILWLRKMKFDDKVRNINCVEKLANDFYSIAVLILCQNAYENWRM